MGNPRAQLKALLEQRLPVYEKLARITVHTDGRDPDEVAADIEALIAGASRDGRPEVGRRGGRGGGRGHAGGSGGVAPSRPTQ
jgi:hypothetical protein